VGRSAGHIAASGRRSSTRSAAPTRRSQVGRASVYRHWPDRVDLLLDGLADVQPEPLAWTSSGDLAADLTRELGRLQRILDDSPFVPELVALLGRAEWDPPLRDL
jgi:hypothetical protein